MSGKAMVGTQNPGARKSRRNSLRASRKKIRSVAVIAVRDAAGSTAEAVITVSIRQPPG
jgi:hypothetical protein